MDGPLDILPMKYRFDYHNLKLFHQIVHKLSYIIMLPYLHFFEGSRLKFTHLDRLSITSDIISACRFSDNNTKRGFSNSYFYRAHMLWNRLPYALRVVTNHGAEFKSKLVDNIWKNLVDFGYESDS